LRIEFIVHDIPPKKHGEKSMWDHPTEVPRLILLRKQAFQAMKEMGLRDCLRSLITLELTLYVPRSNLESIGDLDNFITGVCDGLQAAHSNIKKFHEAFSRYADIHPTRTLLIENDSRIVSIQAKKEINPEDDGVFYKIAVQSRD
jgi:hypothetical protein